ncbi:YkyA family protein [Evansella sp. AB-P1]|uniref:YkyA family protein n=1 Tax=Evansella sp. AB-P1 TaxID=3037653 RepID=UPI00241EC976|nr:YkyA family protein [Evansella sp. AB-P1]MDG5789488.1 YkyA family protein [Evansella sp. AB-P1]
MKKLFMLFFVVLLIPILAGCEEEDNPVEFMYEHLEEAVSIERAVGEKQDPLTEAEDNELQWYTEMSETSDMEEIEYLAQQAIQSAEDRRELMEEEKEIIDEAFEEFQLAKPFIDDIEDESLQNNANSMVSIMEDRYEVYQELYEHYIETIDMDIELYTMYFQEDLAFEELQQQHDLVNEAYQRINELNQEFNEYTANFNESKRDFYDLAELDVVFE